MSNQTDRDVFTTVTGNGVTPAYVAPADGYAQIIVSGTFEAAGRATVQIAQGGTDFVAPDADAVLSGPGALRLPVKHKTEVRVATTSNASNVLKISIS